MGEVEPGGGAAVGEDQPVGPPVGEDEPDDAGAVGDDDSEVVGPADGDPGLPVGDAPGELGPAEPGEQAVRTPQARAAATAVLTFLVLHHRSRPTRHRLTLTSSTPTNPS